MYGSFIVSISGTLLFNNFCSLFFIAHTERLLHHRYNYQHQSSWNYRRGLVSTDTGDTSLMLQRVFWTQEMLHVSACSLCQAQNDCKRKRKNNFFSKQKAMFYAFKRHYEGQGSPGGQPPVASARLRRSRGALWGVRGELVKPQIWDPWLLYPCINIPMPLYQHSYVVHHYGE